MSLPALGPQAGQLRLQLGDPTPFARELRRELVESGPQPPSPGRDNGRGHQACVGRLVGHGSADSSWLRSARTRRCNCTKARSPLGNAPRSVAESCEPSASVTRKLRAPATTCALVTTCPAASSTTPEPSPLGLRICTTDGSARATTGAKPAREGALGGGAAIAGPAGWLP